MSSHHEVSHEGIILSIDGQKAQVSVLVKSACSSCHIKGACNLAEIQEKIIEADLKGQEYKAGERVNVVMRQRQGLIAVLLAYLVPAILIVISLIVVNQLTANENLAAGVSIFSAGIYYLLLFFNRKFIGKSFSFRLKKIDY